MNIEIPLTMTMVFKLNPMRKRWLAYQTDGYGHLVYAEAFIRHSNAVKAAKAANGRKRKLLDGGLFDPRLPAQVDRLPVDLR